ncbi:hypothetical protein [Paenibacillus silagei]|uniref:Transposase-like protein n=1 Tax=Paenibacillus silagei TaxID=1670801 RepID=A0ABS4NJ00_9BACL|nr:hypothetical protein [Paenibacillus silagei]MBP2110011.1 transposase-like protein [Paenibacillus silagei]
MSGKDQEADQDKLRELERKLKERNRQLAEMEEELVILKKAKEYFDKFGK